ncbi:MAG: hypothetical protein EOO73_03030 [Myxococcales bacterium]|nr:MAG: hypothetical protein EOO73_03030 [Myxococcales bacterium]
MRSVAIASLLATLCLSHNVRAADDASRGAARKLAQAGVEALQEQHYDVASEKLERAYAVLRVPSIALWSARALEKRGKLVEASERYLEATRLDAAVGDAAVQRQARAEAEAERQALLARIPSLTIALSGAPAAATQVTIDGEEWPSALWGEPRPTNPGEHELRALHGAEEVKLKVTLAEGDKRSETLAFQAPATPAPAVVKAPPPLTAAPASTQRTLGFVAVGVGGAGLLVGAVTGILVASRHSDLEGSCNAQHQCDPARQSDIDSYNSLRPISTVALVAGGVVTAAGVTLLLTAPRSDRRTELSLGAASLRLTGTF